MEKITGSNITWEVKISYSWGTSVNTVFKTREEARKFKREAISRYTGIEFAEVGMYKVTCLPGLSKLSGEGVYMYKKVY